MKEVFNSWVPRVEHLPTISIIQACEMESVEMWYKVRKKLTGRYLVNTGWFFSLDSLADVQKLEEKFTYIGMPSVKCSSRMFYTFNDSKISLFLMR